MGKRIGLLLFGILIPFLLSAKTSHAQTESGSSATLAMNTEIVSQDKRVVILFEYLKKYNSPLVPYASVFVKQADLYDLDYRLLVAISGVESTFGREIPYNSYNAWGWGIYGDNTYNFSSYEEAIETISKALREKFLNQWNAKDIYGIGKYYAASPTWAGGVGGFMNEIEAFELQNPSLTLSLSI